MNMLFCSVGRRGELIKNFKETFGDEICIVATDNSEYAPALYLADKSYIVPLISDDAYLDIIIKICETEKIQAITTFIDPEIELLSKNREAFNKIGVEVLAPSFETAEICFDKYLMYKYLEQKNIPTVKTFDSFDAFKKDYADGRIDFPVFVKPRTGSGSVGARKILNLNDLELYCADNSDFIIQEFMAGEDIDADVYIDTVSHKVVRMFTKKKIETKIGGANKTISFTDKKLFDLIDEISEIFHFNGPIDMDFFYDNERYYLSEINPRFGGAYLHAYGAGVNFPQLIYNNVNGMANERLIGNYEEDIVMMMYDSVVICHKSEMDKKVIVGEL